MIAYKCWNHKHEYPTNRGIKGYTPLSPNPFLHVNGGKSESVAPESPSWCAVEEKTGEYPLNIEQSRTNDLLSGLITYTSFCRPDIALAQMCEGCVGTDFMRFPDGFSVYNLPNTG